MATHLGAHLITNERTDDLADAAADASPGARTVARTNRATLEDANHSTLTTTQFYAFFGSNLRAVVPTLASADDAAVGGTHYFTFGGTDAQKNGKAHDSTDCVHQRQNRK